MTLVQGYTTSEKVERMEKLIHNEYRNLVYARGDSAVQWGKMGFINEWLGVSWISVWIKVNHDYTPKLTEHTKISFKC